MASGKFKDVLTQIDAATGTTYPYYANVRTPSEIGMSSKGTLKQMGKDVDGLVEYVKLLVSGNSKASATGKPLGNRYFLPTGAKCTAPDGSTQDRYLYVDNVPAGNIPFISGAMGVDFKDFRGLVPGALGNLNALNPSGLLHAFVDGATPPCQSITMATLDTTNHAGTETQYVTLADIERMDPCSFPAGKNPRTQQKCRSAFTMPRDDGSLLFFAGVASVGLYVLTRLA